MRSIYIKNISLALILSISLMGCANTSKEAWGTGGGAVAGAALGYGLGGGAAGTIGGAAAGALIGNQIGKGMED